MPGTKQEAGDRKRCLHDRAARVRGFPLRQRSAVVELQARRVLGNTHLKRGAGEQGRGDEGELS